MADDDLERRARERLGTTLNGKYRLDALLGLGGMAAVYRATHRNRAELAVKMLHPELGQNRAIRTRFLREAYAANSVKHPGAVVVVDDDLSDDGEAFLVMELLDGATVEELADRRSRTLPLPVAVAVVDQLLDVLAAAHDAGVVHRDVKPANLFVTREGTLKVLDFGIARVLEPGPTSPGVTGAGLPVGTPAFMAPEQALAHSDAIGPRTDIWAAGATLFTLLAGVNVHEYATAAETLAHAATRPARSLAEVAPGTPAAIVAVVDRALAFDSAARWPSARAMAEALESAFAQESGAAPLRTVLAALFPPRATARRPAGESDLGSAPTIDAVGQAPESRSLGDQAAPVSSTAAPVRAPRRSRARAVAGLALLGVGLVAGAGALLHGRPSPAPAPSAAAPPPTSRWSAPTHDRPAQVLLLGFDNRTTDPVFDGTLDLVLESALMRSSALYPLAGASVRALVAEIGPAAEGNDDVLGRALVERTHRPVALVRGTIAQDGAGYALSLDVRDGGSGAKLSAAAERASDGRELSPALARLACALRAALRDEPCDATSMGETGMSDNLEADHEFAAGRGAINSGKFGVGITAMQRAVALDPGFTAAQQALGLMLWNAGRSVEGRVHMDLALSGAGRLSERQRLTMSASRALLLDDLDQAARAYVELLTRWPADGRSLGNLAQVYLRQGDLTKATDAARRAVAETPRSPTRNANLFELGAIAGDFEGTAREGPRMLAEFPNLPGFFYTSLASAYVLLGRRADAVDVLGRMEASDVSSAVTAKADHAMYEGRLADAVALLRAGIADDVARKATADAEAKYSLLAEALLRRGDEGGARRAAEQARDSKEIVVMTRVGRVFAEAGRLTDAEGVAKALAERTGQRARTYARLVEVEMRKARHAPASALDDLLPTGSESGSWLAHADLGAAYFAAGAFDRAETELETCLGRLGAGAEAFYDSLPTLRYIPKARYWLARTREALHRPDTADAYRRFLDAEAPAADDPLLQDARKRTAAL